MKATRPPASPDPDSRDPAPATPLDAALLRLPEWLRQLRRGAPAGVERGPAAARLLMRLLLEQARSDLGLGPGCIDVGADEEGRCDPRALLRVRADLLGLSPPLGQIEGDLLGAVYERCLSAVRRDRGVFYTPAPIARALSARTVGRLASTAVDQALAQWRGGDQAAARRTIEREVLGLRVLDPACGAGTFLLAAAADLAAAYRRFEQAAPALSVPDWADRILQRCVHGIDLDPFAVQLSRLNLLLWRARQGGAGGDAAAAAAAHLIVGNSLLGPGDGGGGDAPVCARTQLGGGAFDVVLSNPPYVGEEGHRELFRPVAAGALLGRYYEGKMDYAYFFVHLALDLCRPGGLIGLLLPSYLYTATGARRLNRRLTEESAILEVFDFGGHRVFASSAPGHNSLILILRRGADPDLRPQVSRLSSPAGRGAQGLSAAALAQALFSAGPGAVDSAQRSAAPSIDSAQRSAAPFIDSAQRSAAPFIERFEAPPHRALLDPHGALRLLPAGADQICARMAHGAAPLSALCHVDTGLQAGPAVLSRPAAQRLSRLWDPALGPAPKSGDGVFVLTAAEVAALRLSNEEAALLRPLRLARQVRLFGGDAAGERWVLYLTAATCPDLSRHPALLRHLGRFRPLLEARRETQDGRRAYFHLHWPRAEEIFLGPRLLSVRQTARPALAYESGEALVDLSMNVVRLRDAAQPERLWALLGLLGAAPAHFWFYHRGKRKGDLLQIDGAPLSGFPVPALVPDAVAELAARARELSAPGGGGPERAAQREGLDRLVARLYGVDDVPLAVLRAPQRPW